MQQIYIPVEVKAIQTPEIAKASLKDLAIADNKQLFLSFFEENKIKGSGNVNT